MEVPAWMPFHGAITAFVFVAQFFLSMAGTLPTTGGNVFTFMLSLIGFTAIAGLPAWVSFVFFMVISLPWILLLAAYVFELAQASLTGTAAVVLLAATITGLAFFL